MYEEYNDHHNQIAYPNIVHRLIEINEQIVQINSTYCNFVRPMHRYNQQFDYNARILEYIVHLFHISIHEFHKHLIKSNRLSSRIFSLQILLVVENKSKKFEQKKNRRIFKFIKELSTKKTLFRYLYH